MGKDKFENEELIEFGFPEDIWFHVNSLSSAHVYIRMNEGEDFRSLPADLVMECCHLVKHNSIEGCKKEVVSVVYTPCPNLKKTADMAPGQVSFHNKKEVIKVKNVERGKDIVKALYKSKEEKFPDLRKLRQEKENKMMREQKVKNRLEKAAQNEVESERRAEAKKWEDARDDFDDEDNMVSNKDQAGEWDDEDDFM